MALHLLVPFWGARIQPSAGCESTRQDGWHSCIQQSLGLIQIFFPKIFLHALCWNLLELWLGAAFAGDSFCYMLDRRKCHAQQGVEIESLPAPRAADQIILMELPKALLCCPCRHQCTAVHSFTLGLAIMCASGIKCN